MDYRQSLVLLPALFLIAYTADAQVTANVQGVNSGVQQAYNLSNLTVQGTARSMGFGNALGSIGGDFSSISVNPAGLGIYRKSEATFTPALRINSSSSLYQGVATPDNNVRFNVNNWGLVFTNAPGGKRYEKRKWKAVSFAMGINKVADLNHNYSYGGVNSDNSGTLAMESDANIYYNEPRSTAPLTGPGYLGYQAYLLNLHGNNSVRDSFISIVPFQGGVDQKRTVEQRGRVNEFVLSLGGNYKEQLMLGATVGIPTVRYSVASTYSESLAPGNTVSNYDTFVSYRLSETTTVKGNGANLKLGAIFKASDNVRIGAAFHSPTIYSLSEVYAPGISSEVGSYHTELTTANTGTTTAQFNYSFITPWRGILSGSYIMKGVGFLTFDYEYIGYNSMGYIYPSSDGNGGNYEQGQYDMNQTISSTYKNTSNFRLGAEALVTKYFMARAGFGYYSNPYKTAGVNGQRLDVSAGIGFHDKDFFADLAVVHSAYQSEEQPYNVNYNYLIPGLTPAAVPTATTDHSINNIAFTVGVKF
jgi:hypothetical protein